MDAAFALFGGGRPGPRLIVGSWLSVTADATARFRY
jgi:hypothetical protein